MSSIPSSSSFSMFATNLLWQFKIYARFLSIFVRSKATLHNLTYLKWKLLFVIETNLFFSKCSNVHLYALKWGFSRHVRDRKSVNNSRNKSFLRKFWDVKGFFVCLYFDKIRTIKIVADNSTIVLRKGRSFRWIAMI